MYAYLKGILIETDEDGAVIETGGIGYNVRMMPEQLSVLPPRGTEVKIYTYTSVREDALWLYGFLTHDELKMFKLLITVSGIGPKGAQGVLAVMSPSDLRFAIFSGDAKSISKAPGVGAKSAQRIILELKDKVSIEDNLAFDDEDYSETSGSGSGLNPLGAEAACALAALGYSRADSLKAVSQVPFVEGMTVEDILKNALKNLAFM